MARGELGSPPLYARLVLTVSTSVFQTESGSSNLLSCSKMLHKKVKRGNFLNKNRKETTKYLSKLLEQHLNPHNDTRLYIAKEVTFYYFTSNAIRVDYMQFKPVNNTVSGIEKGDFLCFEIKSSVEDFLSKNGHNFIGDYNYYVMPEDVFCLTKDRIPYSVGVYCPHGDELKCFKKARRCDRKCPALQMLLMMFRSSNRENIKNKRSAAITLQTARKERR